MKKLLIVFIYIFYIFFVPTTFAAGNNSFVSIVNPVRGSDFWDVNDQKPETAVFGQIEILNNSNLPASWLLRFDAFDSENVINLLKNRNSDEKGLFLEVTPSWAQSANVAYHKSDSWHNAGSAFLTGYEQGERKKLIDAAFSRFKSIFGYSPLSVGAWWIDSYSLGYMREKYGITGALIVADQYSTDNYQIWGQYFGTPYYPSKNNALHPAQNLENKLDVVMMQWAPRDPVNSYGNGVSESTFSVQANDYMDYHNLDTRYFSTLLDIYTKQKFNRFGHLIVGLENSYDWAKYSNEYKNQLELLAAKKNFGQLSVVTMKDFALWYKSAFPKLSPQQLIIVDDPMGSFKKTVWFMNPYYRVGWFLNSDGSVFRDIRQYIDGEEELCFRQRCDSVNFATSATRVLDDVSFGTSWKIDDGKISNFKIDKQNEEFLLSYTNEAGSLRKITFLPRDIGVDGKIFSIDSAILNATKKEDTTMKNSSIADSSLKWSPVSVLIKIAQYLIFLIFAVILPGVVLTHKIFNKNTPILLRLSIAFIVGLVMLTFLFYITSLFKIRPLIFVYILLNLILFISLKLYNLSVNLSKISNPYNFAVICTILAGVIFQVVPAFQSGLSFGYGMGFWGPNTHDGLWHIALINQLIKAVPPENPIYSSAILKNYHFFYDLAVAATSYILQIPVVDLVFRFYPIMFSVMLGISSYYFIMKLFANKLAAIFGLYLIYFAGSFGWIVEFIREKHFGGESAFWANQAVSFNLNPPFAISLIIIIAIFHIIFSKQKSLLLAIVLTGSLIGFKSYGAVLVLGTMLLVGIIKKQWYLIVSFIGALPISAWIFLSNFSASSTLLVFMPFWFIHSMIDSPDRVGWARLSLAREVGITTKNWFKFFSAEALSLFIFIAGNLGMRIFSLLSLVKIKSIIKDEKLLFVFVFSILSFLTPILFIQSGNSWNTIQFLYYGLYTASIAAGAVLSSIIFRLPKYISGLIIFLVLVLAPINSAVTANGYLVSRPHAFISSKELEGLQFLSSQPDGVVLTYPYDEKLKTKITEPWPLFVYDSTAYVSAFSKKVVYLEDIPQNQILLTDYKKRLVASYDFFQRSIGDELKFLKDNSIKYIYIPKIFNARLDESTGVIKNIFENEEVVIYKAN